MQVRRCEQVQPQPMDMAGARGVALRVMIGRDDGAPHFAMRHFTVAPGGCTPLHEHNFEHEVYVVAGKGIVRGGDTQRAICAGDTIYMPAKKTHQFRNAGDEPLEFLCLVPLSYDCADGTCQPTPGT